MLFAAGDFFPAWMMYSSLGFALGAAGLFIYGDRQRKKQTATQPPSVVDSDNAPTPPMPSVAVASQPLSADDPNAKRRSGFRRVGNPVAVVVCDAEFKEPPRRGWVVDRSRHGVRLSLLEKFETGTILQVRPTTAPDNSMWIAVEVRNCKPGEQDTFELGCKFTTQPPWEMLLLFG